MEHIIYISICLHRALRKGFILLIWRVVRRSKVDRIEREMMIDTAVALTLIGWKEMKEKLSIYGMLLYVKIHHL